MVDSPGKPCCVGYLIGEDGSVAVGDEALSATRSQGGVKRRWS
ncbi:hypothetical protein [Streptomyces sp. NPDC050564]